MTTKEQRQLMGYVSNHEDTMRDLEGIWTILCDLANNLNINDPCFSRINTAKQYIASILNDHKALGGEK